MSQPVKLSDQLVLDARLTGEAAERSIAGQIEFWAKLGRHLEAMLGWDKVLPLCQKQKAPSLSKALGEVGTPAGDLLFNTQLQNSPFPHFTTHPKIPGLLIRTESDGSTSVGKFVNRKFQVAKSSKSSNSTLSSKTTLPHAQSKTSKRSK